MVRQADRTRLDQPGAAADDRRHGVGVVRRLVGRARDARVRAGEQPGQRVHLGHLDRLPELEVGKQPGEALGQHRLAGTGRSFEEEVMPAGRGDLDAPSRLVLAAHVAQVRLVGRRRRRAAGRQLGPQRCRDARRRGLLPAEHRDALPQRLDAEHVDAVDQLRFPGVEGRHDDPLEPVVERRQHGRQHSRHRAQPAVEAQLTEGHRRPKRLGWQPALGDEERERDRQVVVRAHLADVCGVHPDGDLEVRPLLLAVDQRGTAAVSGLGNRRVGQAAERPARDSVADVGLDTDQPPHHPVERHRVGDPGGHLRRARRSA